MSPVSREPFKQNNETAFLWSFPSSPTIDGFPSWNASPAWRRDNTMPPGKYVKVPTVCSSPKEGPKVLSVQGEIKQTSISTPSEKLILCAWIILRHLYQSPYIVSVSGTTNKSVNYPHVSKNQWINPHSFFSFSLSPLSHIQQIFMVPGTELTIPAEYNEPRSGQTMAGNKDRIWSSTLFLRPFLRMPSIQHLEGTKEPL